MKSAKSPEATDRILKENGFVFEDVLVRRARMQGFNACWVPGTDHASIATEAKVVAKLKAEGINKKDITREEFLKHAWEWTDKYGGTILEQLKKLGCSCDWDRTRFTLEDNLSKSVIKVFLNLVIIIIYIIPFFRNGDFFLCAFFCKFKAVFF